MSTNEEFETVVVNVEQASLNSLGGKYQFLSVVAHGGMSVVYRARQMLLDKIVAIKLLNVKINELSSPLSFLQEAKLASSLAHPNVTTVHDFGTSESGQPFLVMDFVEGASLAQLIANDGPLRADRAVDVFIQATAGLSHAHAKGIVHGDLRASNLLVTHAAGIDNVTIVDFGITKFNGDASASKQFSESDLCHLQYYSPEKCIGQKLDARSDIYSLGCIMYEALTGSVPFTGKFAVESALKHVNEVPPKMGDVCEIPFSDDLQEIVQRCLAKDPHSRYQTSDELRADLEAVRDDKPLPSKQSRTFAQGRSSTPVIGLVIGLLIAVLSTFAAVAAWDSFQDNAGRGPDDTANHSQAQLAPPGTLDAKLVDDNYLTNYLRQAGPVDKLILSKSRISPASMDQIRKQEKLKMLYLDDTAIGDKELSRLQTLPNLWYLNLDNTQITDQSLGTIRQFKKLTCLHVKGTQLTPHAIDILIQALPECEIGK